LFLINPGVRKHLNRLDIPIGDLIDAANHFGIELPSSRGIKDTIKELKGLLNRYFEKKNLDDVMTKLRMEGYYALHVLYKTITQILI
jgi:hypothetical protein